MADNVVQFGLPFLATVLFMCALRPVARGVGLIDKPGGRKMHVGDVPVIGGLAMTGGLIIGSLYSHPSIMGFAVFIAALSMLVLIGALDDRYDLPASVRFLAQICAALLTGGGVGVVVAGGGRRLFGELVELGWWTVPSSVTLLLSAIKACRLSDGSDGVAGA